MIPSHIITNDRVLFVCDQILTYEPAAYINEEYIIELHVPGSQAYYPWYIATASGTIERKACEGADWEICDTWDTDWLAYWFTSKRGGICESL